MELTWNQLFEAICRYNEGNFQDLEPDGNEDNNELEQWVELQRQEYQSGNMPDHIIHKFRTNSLSWILSSSSSVKENENGATSFPSPAGPAASTRKRSRQGSHNDEKDSDDDKYTRASSKKKKRTGVKQQLYFENELRAKNDESDASEDESDDCWKKDEDFWERTYHLSNSRKADNRKWRNMYEELKAFRNQHGHCNVPRKFVSSTEHRKGKAKLGLWVNKQRSKYRNGRLSKERFELLQKLGFRLSRVRSSRNKHEHCNVPDKFVSSKEEWKNGSENQLGCWVSKASQVCWQGRPSQEKCDLFDKLGCGWQRPHVDWKGMHKELKGFQSNHGDCSVPKRFISSPEHQSGESRLGRWVTPQRSAHRYDNPRAKRYAMLNELGFARSSSHNQNRTEEKMVCSSEKPQSRTESTPVRRRTQRRQVSARPREALRWLKDVCHKRPARVDEYDSGSQNDSALTRRRLKRFASKVEHSSVATEGSMEESDTIEDTDEEWIDGFE